MKIKLNSSYQRDEVDRAMAHLTASESDQIEVRATIVVFPDELKPRLLEALETNRQLCLGRHKGRCNAIASVRRHIEAAS